MRSGEYENHTAGGAVSPVAGIDERALDTLVYERTMEGALGGDLVRRIDGALSADQRKTLELYLSEGYTFEEIAARLGQTPGNVRNHYYLALERIRRLVFRPQGRAK